MASSVGHNPITRRWYVVLVGLILTVALVWAARSMAPSQYSARGLVLVLPSRDVVGARGNPLLNLGGLELPTQVLVAYYGSEPAKAEIASFAPTATVQVTIETATNGPVMAVDVTDSTAAGTLRVLNHVVDSIPSNLARIQSNVGATGNAAIRSVPLVIDTEALPENGPRTRMVLAAAVLGLALTLVATFAFDGLALRRRTGAEAEELPGETRHDDDRTGELPVEEGATPYDEGQVDERSGDEPKQVAAPR